MLNSLPHTHRSSSRAPCQPESAVRYDQDFRADRPERAWEEQATFRKLLQSGNDTLRTTKEFYIFVQFEPDPISAHKAVRGMREWLRDHRFGRAGRAGFLNPSDESLDLVRRRGDNKRPKHVAIYRIENELLLAVGR